MMLGFRCKLHAFTALHLDLCRSLSCTSCNLRHRLMSPEKLKLYENPLPEEANILRKKYPDPQGLLENVLASILSVDPSVTPQKTTVPLMPFTPWETWKVHLRTKWPVRFRVTGKSNDIKAAEENAYLLACDMFTDLGLVGCDGQPLNYRETFYELLENVSMKALTTQKMRLVSTRYTGVNGAKWKTEIDCTWPCSLQVKAYGQTQEQSERNATMLICVKLKSLKILNNKNEICNPVVMKLSGNIPHNNIDQLSYDFEFYADASVKGFGGYLVTSSAHVHENPIQWIKEPWPENVLCCYTSPFVPSQFLEFYSIVAIVYTWKKKFQDKCVLCWCDNLMAVDIVNKGLFMNVPAKRNQYYKLFQLLRTTCIRYNIQLAAKHISRMDNVAADSLSKFDVEKFRELFPNAMFKAKKTKKLLFLAHLIPKPTPDDPNTEY